MIKEWNVLRAIASLSIVLLHATTMVSIYNEPIERTWFELMRILLSGATATFILLSIIILSHIYKERLPDDFFKKRIQFLLIPFLAMSILYSVDTWLTVSDISLSTLIIQNMKGGFTGWFVLPIFQLYILFWCIRKFRMNTLHVALITIPIGLLFLNKIFYGYTYNDWFELHHRVYFTTWLAYFGIAYVIGEYYDFIMKHLDRAILPLVIGTLFSANIVYTNYIEGFANPHSRRLDLVLFVLLVSLLILVIGRKVNVPRFIHLISHYSFGIFLIHWLVQERLVQFIIPLSSKLTVQISLLFVGSLIVSIGIIFICSRIPFGAYLVGKVKRLPPKERKIQS